MTAPIYNEEHRRFAGIKVVAIARNILSGESGIVAGARQLVGWRFDLGAEQDPDFTYFVGLDSETDGFPIGEARSRWSADALKSKDEQLRAYEASVRNVVFRICRNLIQKYENLNGDTIDGE